MATIPLNGSDAPSEPETTQLCDEMISGPELAMLVELFRRTRSGQSTAVCDLIAPGVRPLAESHRVLERLVARKLVALTTKGKRFQQVELSLAAWTEMQEMFPGTL